MLPKKPTTILNQILIIHQIQPALFLGHLLEKSQPLPPIHLVLLPCPLNRHIKAQVSRINLCDVLVVETQG
ncbi:hypothetical protein B5E64_02400 [Drancourtella sp. An12]|nr:hypothetical protein B5E64_02400 [Drancourtella sp. An12]